MWTFPHRGPSRPVPPRRARALRRAAATSLLAMLGSIALGGCGNSAAPDAEPATARSAAAESGAASSAATTLQFGDFALYVPADVEHVRGILLALGGPDTRGFAAGTPFGAPPPVEPRLQELGAMLRELATERGLAILGSRRGGPFAYPDGAASDQQLSDGIAQAAALSGHPELADARLLLYGISQGAPEAVGFAQRNPQRVGALFLKVPLGAGPLTGDALDIPGYIVLHERDDLVDNATLRARFAAYRAAGAPWALALEPGALHASLSPAERDVTLAWMRTIVPLWDAGPFRQRMPQVGWFGDPLSGEIAHAGKFTGDLATASWFPMQRLATQWAAFTGL